MTATQTKAHIPYIFWSVGKCSINCDGCLAGTTGLGHTLPGAGGERVYHERKRYSQSHQSQKSWFRALDVSEGNHNPSLCSRPGDIEDYSSGQVPELHEHKTTFKIFLFKSTHSPVHLPS